MMNDDLRRLMWVYRAVFTQTNAGGGNIRANVTARERTLLLYGRTGPDDYAANKIVTVKLFDVNDDEIAMLMSNGTVDNQAFPFPISDISVVADKDGPQLEKRLLMAVGDYLRFDVGGLNQNNTFTIAIRALLGDNGAPPTITTTGSTGTVTTGETDNRVV